MFSVLGQRMGQASPASHLLEVLMGKSISLKTQAALPTHFPQLGAESESPTSGNGRVSVEWRRSHEAAFKAQSSRPQCGWLLCVSFGKTSHCSGTQFLYLQNKGMISKVPSTSKIKFFKKCPIK